MSFISLEFIIFVLAAMLFYYIIPKKFRFLVLLVFSYIFYYIAYLY